MFQWVTLEQAKHGMVHLRFTWLALSSDYNDLKAVSFLIAFQERIKTKIFIRLY